MAVFHESFTIRTHHHHEVVDISADVKELVRSLQGKVDPADVFHLSGGNALMARELADASGSGETVPRSLKELIGDRIDRLSSESRNVLRWGSVLGPAFDIGRLTELVSFDFDSLMNALAELERRALLKNTEASSQMYAFHHALDDGRAIDRH